MKRLLSTPSETGQTQRHTRSELYQKTFTSTIQLVCLGFNLPPNGFIYLALSAEATIGDGRCGSVPLSRLGDRIT